MTDCLLFVSWLDGLGDVPGEFTYFCSIEKYLIAGTEFRRAPFPFSLAAFCDPVSYSRFIPLFGYFSSLGDTTVAGCHGRSKLPLH